MNTYTNGAMPLKQSLETKLGSKKAVTEFQEWYKSLKTGNIVNRNYGGNKR